MKAWGRWVREPLVQFLAVGLVLFGVNTLFGPAASSEAGRREIRLDDGGLLRFVQFRMRRFDEEQARAWLASLAPAERKRLVDDYVREEALYREALAWGLDKDDYVIRRRLVQSVEFAAREAGEAPASLSEGDLRRFHAAHADRYRQPPTISFGHVFLSAERRGWAGARSLAARMRANLDGDAEEIGDRFLYQRNYVESGGDLIESQFGRGFRERLAALKADPGRWQGPIESDHGVHFVRITGRNPGGVPAFDRVRNAVERDAREADARRRERQFVDGILAGYHVRGTVK